MDTTTSSHSIFRTGKNSWRIATAARARVLVDCADYYRAIHAAFTRARHSIFIVGWEIDSEIRLLRGDEEKNSEYPSVVVELLARITAERPQLKVYMLRWDASLAFIGERELLPEQSWTAKTPENVHVILDDTIPIGGSHHQKIILVDDELVFTGGMDIARQRWDERAHLIPDPERADAGGAYGPYHDAQLMMDGPVVRAFAELVRWRWRNAAGYEAVPERPDPSVPASVWPETFPPVFDDIPVSVARTLPKMEGAEEAREVRRVLLDLIAEARDFIYIENQFLTDEETARALNRRLQERPRLRALLVSSFDPQGIMESEAMWAARIDFKKILEAGIEASRARILCTGTRGPDGGLHYKRIHAKILIVDDRFLHVGSANLNSRSMSVDTECDVTLVARTPQHATLIRHVRDELIGEHAGLSAAEVRFFLRRGGSPDVLARPPREGRYALLPVNDSQFTEQNFQSVARALADPKEPLVPELKNPRKPALIAALIAAAFAAIAFIVWKDHQSWFSPETIRPFLERSRRSAWALPAVCLIFTVGGFVLFPVTVLSLVTAAVFGRVWGPVYAMAGALTSGAVMYGIGHFAGLKGIRRLLGDRIRKLDKLFEKAGIIGVAVIRFLPVAPYSIVNLAAGISSVRFLDFMIGSFLGFLPMFVVKGFVGDSLLQVFLNPTMETTVYLVIGISLWFMLVVASYFFSQRWYKRRTA